jgi:hypothetical protein
LQFKKAFVLARFRALEAENADLKEEYNNLKTVGQIPPLQVGMFSINNIFYNNFHATNVFLTLLCGLFDPVFETIGSKYLPVLPLTGWVQRPNKKKNMVYGTLCRSLLQFTFWPLQGLLSQRQYL